MKPELKKERNGNSIMAFPLIPGQVNIAAAGGAKTTELFCCDVDGVFTITWEDTTTANINMVHGEVFSAPPNEVVTVLATGGATFHYM